MSIQENFKKSLATKARSAVDIVAQVAKRELTAGTPKVFFRYKTSNTHPVFDRFYKHPPVAWANFQRCNLMHWINYPALIRKIPFIVECNDHPLSAVSYKNRGIFEPVEVIRRLEDVAKVFTHPECKRIIIPCDGFEQLFSHYFGDHFVEKFERIHSPGCLPKVTQLDIENSDAVVFACLASDYELKGVDLVIDAWRSLPRRGSAKLLLACPNVPESVAMRITADSGIILINKAPLSIAEKHSILSQASVTLSPTHVHAGGNIIEGMEYGHAVIHFSIHSTAFDGVGKKIDVPYHFYLPGYYGLDWKTFSEFKSRLVRDKAAGVFASTVSRLTEALEYFIENRAALQRSRSDVLKKAYESYSLHARNEKLLTLYNDVLNQS